MGSLLAAFEMLWLLLGRPEESPESRLGSLFQTPYFLGDFVNVPERIGAIACLSTNDQMERSVL